MPEGIDGVSVYIKALNCYNQCPECFKYIPKPHKVCDSCAQRHKEEEKLEED